MRFGGGSSKGKEPATMSTSTEGSMKKPEGPMPGNKRGYNLFLLMVAGLGGLLYGVDVGIIGGALPYLQATSHLTNAHLSIIVAAVLLG
ncbi:MAG: hypothetical protein ACRD2D_10680, partial [Terriglobales bacterium]